MKNKEAGFGIILEMIFAVALLMTIFALATTNIVQVRASQNQRDAAIRLRQVNQALAAQAICAQTPGCTPSVGLTNAIPADGSTLTTGGYRFSYSWNGGYWFMSADPVSPGFSGVNHLYIDYTGQLRGSATGSANATSPAW